MALYIKKYQKKNRKSNTYGKWYGRAVMLETADIDDLATEIEEKCTVTRSDILAVLSAMGGAIKHTLQDSKRVRIPYLGTFKLGVNSTGETDEEEYDVKSNITNVHVIFQPETTVENGHRVKELTRGARVAELAKKLENGTADNSNSQQGGGDDQGGNDNQGGDGNQGGGSNDPVEERP